MKTSRLVHGSFHIHVSFHTGHNCFHLHITPKIIQCSFFLLQVTGIDSEGFDFLRITPTAISAILPAPPKVDMVPQTRGFYDKTATLYCPVESLVPFTVQWYREGETLGNLLYFRYVWLKWYDRQN